MIKRLLKSVREFKKDALLTPFFVVLEVVMEVIIPMVMALLIDKGIDGQDMAAIWKYGIILVLCAMLALVFGAAAGTFAARASTGFARNLRHDMYYNVQNFSFSNIDKFSTGSIVTRLTTDVTERLSDVHTHCGALPGHAGLCAVHGDEDQQQDGARIPRGAADSGNRYGHSDEGRRPGL